MKKILKQIKGSEIVKIAMAVILSIGLFSAAFLGINSYAFAAATNKTENLPPVATTASATATAKAATAPAAVNNKTENLPPVAATAPATATVKAATAMATAAAAANNKTENDPPAAAAIAAPAMEAVPPTEYKKPEMTVYQQHNEWFTPSANALSPEEAAEIGAKYIWDMFGESIDGKTVGMYYSAHPSHTRAYWHGTVADSRENLDPTDMENYDPQFWFTLCAVSGERIDIANERVDMLGMPREKYRALWTEINMLDQEETEELIRLRDEYPPPERLDEYTQMAESFAAKHFNNTEVIGSRLSEYNSFGDFALDENGKIIIAPNWSIWFTVTDSTGREADLGINMITGELMNLLTQHNDIVPGYSYEGPPGVG